MLLLVVLPLFNTITTNINTTTATTITTMPKGMKVKFSRDYKGGRWTELKHALCMRVVKRVKRQYLRNTLVCEVETNRATAIAIESKDIKENNLG